jgi:hypothetical protein
MKNIHRAKIPKYKGIIGDTSPTREIPDYEPSEDNGVVQSKTEQPPTNEQY